MWHFLVPSVTFHALSSCPELTRKCLKPHACVDIGGSDGGMFTGERAVIHDLQIRARFLVFRIHPRHPVVESSFPDVVE